MCGVELAQEWLDVLTGMRWVAKGKNSEAKLGSDLEAAGHLQGVLLNKGQ